MNIGNLNLARKWRSKNFDQIVGQDLSVKMLKNSLYLDRFFPVYLFSGQRGCGKTTTARVFAAAINCEQLDAFRKSPKKQLLPCNACASCTAMLSGKHPDFIEMDAASHTGVENVRNIVEAASLLPVMSKKKIYLIDEAHMLSKAAFNAFLKVLEEPPSSVLFILATTDTDKIIDTVKSRCFQLFFNAVDSDPLLNHLKVICSDESIKAHDDALLLIIKETDGSVRDAINVLERVRFSSAAITKKAVQAALGHLDDEQVIRLLEVVLYKTPRELIVYFKGLQLEKVEASFIWRRFVDLLRAAIWLKNGVDSNLFSEYTLLIKDITANCSWMQLSSMLSTLYLNEEIFKRTTTQHSFLEMILLGFCQKYSSNDSSSSSSGTPGQAATAAPEVCDTDDSEEGYEDDQDDEDESDEEEVTIEGWHAFIQELVAIQDPLLTTIFKQAQLDLIRKDEKTLKILLPKELQFFSDWIDDAEHLWRPVLLKHFGEGFSLDAVFTLNKKAAKTLPEKAIVVTPPIVKQDQQRMPRATAPVQQKPFQPTVQKKQVYQHSTSLGKKIQSKDLVKFPQAAMILRHFPGDLYELHES